MLQCVASDINFFQHIVSGSVARKKRTYLKKKLSYINSDDEAQYRRIKDAVKAFKETRLRKEKNHETGQNQNHWIGGQEA